MSCKVTGITDVPKELINISPNLGNLSNTISMRKERKSIDISIDFLLNLLLFNMNCREIKATMIARNLKYIYILH